ncbi:MAG TPA: hypothetical protein VGK62_05090 [Gaiellaceae bacterium]
MASRATIIFRAENEDAAFFNWLGRLKAAGQPRPLDGVVVAARYLADYPDGCPLDPRALPDALAAAHLPMLIDPATADLAFSAARKAKSRLLESPIARALDLPFDVKKLTASEEMRQQLFEATSQAETEALVLVPPYFGMGCQSKQALELNLAMVRLAINAATTEVVALVPVTEHAFRDGRLAQLASAYAETGVQRVVFRVRGLRNESMDAQAFGAYLDAVAAFKEFGIRVTIDCAGRAGPPLFAGGADGFATGWYHFRHVAKSPFGGGNGNPGNEPAGYEVAGRYREVPLIRAAMFTCPIPGCLAHQRGPEQRFWLRLHWLHVLRAETDRVAELGTLGYTNYLSSLGGTTAVWGQVLRERATRAA